MMRRTLLSATAALAALLAINTARAEDVTLTVVTAGDQNMVDYVKDYLGPIFEKEHPGVTVKSVGTGPGDAGSQQIYEKLSAEKDKPSWDIDVAVIHQKASAQMKGEGMLLPYTKDVETEKYVTNPMTTNALGVDVKDVAIPMFESQTAIAYNSDIVKEPPKNFDELTKWVDANPGKFGYNGIKGGMAGVGFVVGWIYAYTPDMQKMLNGPYDPNLKSDWDGAFAKLAAFNKKVVMTPGNAGTLDMLGRGEIAMGPVWVDMFYSWQADGKLPPSVKLKLIGPGMPGQPMYYTVPAKAAHAKLAEEFIALATSPQVQADGIVKKFNWYPGIDPTAVKANLDQASWDKLFVDVTPADIAANGKTFPMTPYFNDVLASYEQKVQ